MKPKLYKIIKNDYLTLLCIIAPSVFGILFLVLKFYGHIPSLGRDNSSLTIEDAYFFLFLFIISFFICAPICYKRIKHIKNVFENGEVVLGRVTKIWFYKDRGKIKYEYHYGDYIYESGAGVSKTQDTIGYKEGYQLELVINKKDPTKSLIKSIYL